MDLEVFYEVIVPLLEVDSTAMIAISTPQVRDIMDFSNILFTSTDTITGFPQFLLRDVHHEGSGRDEPVPHHRGRPGV